MDYRNQEAWSEFRNQVADQVYEELMHRNQRYVPPGRPMPSNVFRPGGQGQGGMVAPPPGGGGYGAPQPAYPQPGYPPPASPQWTGTPGFSAAPVGYPGYEPPGYGPPATGGTAIAELIDMAVPFIPLLVANPDTPADQGKQATTADVIDHQAAILNTGKKALLYVGIAKLVATVSRRGRLL